jgi:hypothetical protein
VQSRPLYGFLGQVPCPSNPPPPASSSPWVGPVPADVTAWAKDILNDAATYPMFAEVHAVLDGSPVVAQVQHHTTRGATGETGLCIRGISIFQDVAGATASTNPTAMTAGGNGVGANDAGLTTRVATGFVGQSQGVRTIELVFLGVAALGTAFAIAHALFDGKK